MSSKQLQHPRRTFRKTRPFGRIESRPGAATLTPGIAASVELMQCYSRFWRSHDEAAHMLRLDLRQCFLSFSGRGVSSYSHPEWYGVSIDTCRVTSFDETGSKFGRVGLMIIRSHLD